MKLIYSLIFFILIFNDFIFSNEVSLGRNEEQSLDDVDSDTLLRIRRKKKGKTFLFKAVQKKKKQKRPSSKNTTTTTTEVITTTSTIAPTTTSTKATTYNPNIFTWPPDKSDKCEYRITDLGKFWCHCVYVAQKFRDSMKNFFTGRFFKQSGIRG